MSVISCKMCGGNLIVEEGSVIAECEYCGRKQTIPTVDDEKKLTLFARAGRLLRACEFDKAAGIFEAIVADFPEEAEAYWGLVLCRFGIEYVDDPATGSKVPTCHRSGFDSVMEDKDFEQACENAVPEARRLYREEAKQIEELRKAIIEVSGKEEPYDIFICYKETADNGQRTIDSVLAQDIYEKLTDAGYRVFFSRITLEDKLGTEYEPYIFAALNSAKIMLAFGTDYEHFNAVWVKNEWSRFLKLMEKDKSKRLIPCYRDIDAYDMPKEFAKLQAQDMGKVGADQDLIRAIRKLIVRDNPDNQNKVVKRSEPNVESLLKRGEMFLEDGEMEQANEYFCKALDISPDNTRAHLGVLLANNGYRTIKDYERDYVDELIAPDKYFERVKRYATGQYAQLVNGMESERSIRRQRKIDRLQQRRKEIKNAQRVFAYSSYNGGDSFSDGCSIGVAVDGIVYFAGIKGTIYSGVAAWHDIASISASRTHIVGLKMDGTVVATSNSYSKGCNVSDWFNVIDVRAGRDFTLGLKKDGSILYCGNNSIRFPDSDWQNIIAIAVGSSHIVGLKQDGTVVAAGQNGRGQCEVSDWESIVSIYAHDYVTIGIREDGSVCVSGNDPWGRHDVSDWKDIISVHFGRSQTFGLKIDGTVMATKLIPDAYHRFETEVSNWRDIVAIATGGDATAGLKEDGTAITGGIPYTKEISRWNDLVAIAVSDVELYVALKADGTVIAIGENKGNGCNVSDWRLFNCIDTIGSEMVTVSKQRLEARKELLVQELDSAKKRESELSLELSCVKGLFAEMRKKKMENERTALNKRITDIINELSTFME